MTVTQTRLLLSDTDDPCIVAMTVPDEKEESWYPVIVNTDAGGVPTSPARMYLRAVMGILYPHRNHQGALDAAPIGEFQRCIDPIIYNLEYIKFDWYAAFSS